ncbi:hypothetical protein OEZ85_002235 [Tetradesmus obliquus]|uniref:Uncharacterized protein n=1 Tax=Tetradesmus obliquus TaxID=3088 RepID=A0ABY8U4N1_TETOB|nr:hypothetical protein OEZ85_002235 [Tetradesmus obliquus]
MGTYAGDRFVGMLLAAYNKSTKSNIAQFSGAGSQEVVLFVNEIAWVDWQLRRWLLQKKGDKAGAVDLKQQHVLQVRDFKLRCNALKEAIESGSFKLEERGIEVCTSSSKMTAYKKAVGTASEDIREELRFDETV